MGWNSTTKQTTSISSWKVRDPFCPWAQSRGLTEAGGGRGGQNQPPLHGKWNTQGLPWGNGFLCVFFWGGSGWKPWVFLPKICPYGLRKPNGGEKKQLSLGGVCFQMLFHFWPQIGGKWCSNLTYGNMRQMGEVPGGLNFLARVQPGHNYHSHPPTQKKPNLKTPQLFFLMKTSEVCLALRMLSVAKPATGRLNWNWPGMFHRWQLQKNCPPRWAKSWLTCNPTYRLISAFGGRISICDQKPTKQIHSGKLTQQWKMDPLKMYFLSKMGIFRCYVGLPEGKTKCPTWRIIPGRGYVVRINPIYHKPFGRGPITRSLGDLLTRLLTTY